MNCWMPPYAVKILITDSSQNSRTIGNTTVRKTAGCALWPVTNKCVVTEN
jgi:hypothetical protein